MIEATGKVAEKLVSGFTGAPALLLIVVLNVAMLGLGAWGLIAIAKLSAQGRTEVTSLLQACLSDSRDRQPHP
jgi:hypothetical protein